MSVCIPGHIHVIPHLYGNWPCTMVKNVVVNLAFTKTKLYQINPHAHNTTCDIIHTNIPLHKTPSRTKRMYQIPNLKRYHAYVILS